jgi:radical SAM-linked protein
MKVRIKFAKTGTMKFIGHLDMMRFFQKAVRRAGIDIAYSGGYSPHQIMSFAAPLGVGLVSNGEYFDIELRSETDMIKLQADLSREMTDEITILSATPLSETAGNAMASVAAASYTVRFVPDFSLPTDWDGQLVAFAARPAIPYTKTTKKGIRELDLKPLIYEMKTAPDHLYLLVDASSANNIKPQYLLEAFFADIGITLPEFALLITREETYGNIGSEEQPHFVPLSGLTG